MHIVKKEDWEKRIADLDKQIGSADENVASILKFAKLGMMFSVNVSHEIQVVDYGVH